ncbi:MAG: hypothetical protein IIW87_00530 [Alistipes sp.]|nr:hypothetical protein [Alistipes sp.]
MDNFWIFIVIIGAVISLAQKSPKKASSSDDSPTADPQQELERQIRELLGEKPASKPAPAEQKRAETPAPTPIPTPIITPKNRVDTATSITKPKQQSKIGMAATAKAATHTNKATNKSATGDETNEIIGQIVDDFTMEKAVIYAEILKPKYEEY